MANVFELSDGSTTINLLNQGGVCLVGFEEVIAKWKNGGVFADTPFMDGRTPVQFSYENPVETYEFYVVGSSQNAAAATLRSLVDLLNAAVDYWTTPYNTTPVYLRYKGDTETNSSYAEVIRYEIDKIPQRFNTPFEIGALSGGTRYVSMIGPFQLTIERSVWAATTPFSDSAVNLSQSITYNSVTFSQIATTSENIFVSNDFVNNNLTHVYRYDASGTSWSTNIVNAAPTYQIMPSSLAAGDMTYFGIQSTLSGSSPFHGLVFDVATPSDITSMAYEIYNGAAWVAVSSIIDNTARLTVAGVNCMTWELISNWSAVNLLTLLGGSAPNITAWWFRLRVVTTGSTTPPTQQNRIIYATKAPFASISASEVTADVDLDIRLIAKGRGYSDYVSFILATRSDSRGSNFTPYISASDSHNPSGITVDTDGSVTTFTNASYYPAGRGIYFNPTAARAMSRICWWMFDSTIATEYVGKFRMLLRLIPDYTGIGVPDISGATVQMNIYNGASISTQAPFWTSEIKPIYLNTYYTIDFGIIDIPRIGYDLIGGFSGFTIALSSSAASTEDNFYVTDLLLIPADESYCEYSEHAFPSNTSSLTSVNSSGAIAINGVNRKYNNSAIIYTPATNLTKSVCSSFGLPVKLRKNVAQKLYLFGIAESLGPGGLYNASFNPGGVFSLQLFSRKRYFTPRGSS